MENASVLTGNIALLFMLEAGEHAIREMRGKLAARNVMNPAVGGENAGRIQTLVLQAVTTILVASGMVEGRDISPVIPNFTAALRGVADQLEEDYKGEPTDGKSADQPKAA